MTSKTADVVMLCKGANMILSNLDQAFLYQKKGYDAECRSGFYTIADEDVAKKYAVKFSNVGETPIVNYYRFELGRMKRDCIRQSYFNDLSFKSMDYVGRNISGIFPENCTFKDLGKHPRDLCFECENSSCSWSAPYIEAILSDNVDFSFDDTLKAFIVKDITEEVAVERINSMLHQNHSTLRIRVVVRAGAQEYLHYSHYQSLPIKE